jgi:UPF0755 protein
LKKVVVSLLLLIGLGASAGYYLWQDIHRVMSEAVFTGSDNKTFMVKRGVGFNRLTSQLNDAELIDNVLYFKLYAKYYQLGRGIQAGEYSIKPNTAPKDLLALFSSGDVVRHKVALIEGSNALEIRAQLLNHADVLNLKSTDMNETQLLEAIGATEKKLEGILLAETYQVERGSTDIALLKRAYQSMKKTLAAQWKKRDKKLPYKTPYEALIMASIVEKETGVGAERPVIAGVFVNRMRIGMRLQTDPTVIYGMGERYKGNITRADLRRPSAYNTYVIKRLPPSPIATVGPEAIKAALNPEKTKYLYFVAKGNGSHYFSKNLREHNNAVRRYQLKRKKSYRSAPKS